MCSCSPRVKTLERERVCVYVCVCIYINICHVAVFYLHMSLRGLLYPGQLSVLTALTVIIIQVPATGEINFGWVGADTTRRGEVGWLAESNAHRAPDHKSHEQGGVWGCEAIRVVLFHGPGTLVSLWGSVIQCSHRAALIAGSKTNRYLWPTDLEGTLAQEKTGNSQHGKIGQSFLRAANTGPQDNEVKTLSWVTLAVSHVLICSWRITKVLPTTFSYISGTSSFRTESSSNTCWNIIQSDGKKALITSVLHRHLKSTRWRGE